MTDRPPPALRAQGLSKHYGTGASRFDALRDVDLEIDPGECVAIVGKSGSGKSTLMHLLAVLDSPSSGSVSIHGTDAATLSGRELDRLRNREFGFVFQQFFMVPQSTVLENVALPLTIAGRGRRERRERSLAMLRMLGLEEKASARAATLSGGQKQRAVIARALSGDPSIIFADEPTGNLDSTTGTIVEETLLGLNRDRGITLVIVTHDEELAARCDRRITVRDGRIVDDSRSAVGAGAGR
ncbi:ABC transporter ATP-binding protein [Microcella daejeonensis]|uniref:ABC transporter ATP-binding protein n=1 Tax=Microcella daejeonensis TaxID=2994971 RepID=A0A9E8MM74_9MICO|nr:ABC transporter ATP-binding protein [Microcella daejeonensis]WAB81557.1 ABC transporter ATP-binding protein [Microcella daejeonensis]WAB83704.1 ABC transporter ATP-binding protein [Microcella daejeonensis]